MRSTGEHTRRRGSHMNLVEHGRQLERGSGRWKPLRKMNFSGCPDRGAPSHVSREVCVTSFPKFKFVLALVFSASVRRRICVSAAGGLANPQLLPFLALLTMARNLPRMTFRTASSSSFESLDWTLRSRLATDKPARILGLSVVLDGRSRHARPQLYRCEAS